MCFGLGFVVQFEKRMVTYCRRRTGGPESKPTLLRKGGRPR
jgi:hypothetical protein